ncbi:hypothetical protein Pcinc_038063 [Petrolisthes cinctipes]|uniref:Uncharacterized protein n=1 Tax=Petrolisthes cinctipes TaxID=88211 RepID=A0AAE1EKE8_PETCI|nr:hypothetical protein Pcinc_038063 [Petrolisthes cinctipes]
MSRLPTLLSPFLPVPYCFPHLYPPCRQSQNSHPSPIPTPQSPIHLELSPQLPSSPPPPSPPLHTSLLPPPPPKPPPPPTTNTTAATLLLLHLLSHLNLPPPPPTLSQPTTISRTTAHPTNPSPSGSILANPIINLERPRP